MLTKKGLFILISSITLSMILLLVLFNNYNQHETFFSMILRQATKTENDPNEYQRGALNQSILGKQLQSNQKMYMCGSSIDKFNKFIQEFSLPIQCSQPVALAVDNANRIWVAATWTGHIAIFDPIIMRFTDLLEIPNWKTKGIFGSMVWSMEFDKHGNLWFTDQVNNAIWKYALSERNFEMYKIPTLGSYPGSISIDSQGRVWFSEIFGRKLGVIDPAKTENNTSSGITEYELKGIDFETMGPVTMSHDNKTVWFTAVTFPEGGHIVKFDMNKLEFQIFSIDKGGGVPIGIAEDKYGRLWINDHASNLFFMFNPSNGKMVKYSTSLPTSRNTTTTLPYWNAFYDGRVWFNEHEGNAIAYFDIDNLTLVEYQIPTRSAIWGNTSNPLKFSLDRNGSVWFTQWTENKIGLLDSRSIENIPLAISVSKDKVSLNKNSQKAEALEISVYAKKQEISGPVEMTVAGSMSSSGRLWNMTGLFSESSFQFSQIEANKLENESDWPQPHKVTLWLIPTEDLVTGNYTLTVGARNNGVTLSKIINLEVI